MDKEENRQIISWLTGTDYESIHADYRKKKMIGTSEWITDSTEFLEWLRGDKQTLFCSGRPGAGIAHIYFNYKRHGEEIVEAVIAKTEVETKDSKVLTALSLATQRGYKATVQLLLNAGAEIETDRNATIQSSGFQIWGVLVPPEGIVSESNPGETSVAGTVALAATAEATGERNHSKRSGIYLWAAHSGHVKLRACPEHDVKLFSTLWCIVRDRDPKLKFLAS
ncbi:hypothetical protein TWF225_005337 [Orbilia oligospora]|nr:hypothetical protein TWF751_008605 [Orbilia oligospora]KAF3194712.1 hypothetical protein TWF225_005337 [Orbilia oligospora]KAF3257502.1 hypothetical protein TWF128_005051 [Orbilia oligospora]